MATRDTYRTKSGKYYFEFIFQDKGGFYYAHIKYQPSYGNRPDDGHSTHRLPSDYPGCTYRICLASDNDAPTLNKIRAFATAWCEATESYIKYGRTF